MFYDKYIELCNARGDTPSGAALKIGLTKTTVNRWKKGGGATDATLKKVADYFGVDVSFLKKETPTFISESGLGETKYDQLTPEHRKIVDSLIDQLLASQSPE